MSCQGTDLWGLGPSAQICKGFPLAAMPRAGYGSPGPDGSSRRQGYISLDTGSPCTGPSLQVPLKQPTTKSDGVLKTLFIHLMFWQEAKPDIHECQHYCISQRNLTVCCSLQRSRWFLKTKHRTKKSRFPHGSLSRLSLRDEFTLQLFSSILAHT